jgi:hypothetical protein
VGRSGRAALVGLVIKERTPGGSRFYAARLKFDRTRMVDGPGEGVKADDARLARYVIGVAEGSRT